MQNRTAVSRNNSIIRFLLHLSPAARLGVIVLLLALAMAAAGLGIRSALGERSPIRHNERPLMVFQAPPVPGVPYHTGFHYSVLAT